MMEELDYERLAELHWISYTLPARIRGLDAPMWEELPAIQRECLTTAMQMMVDLGHLDPGTYDDLEEEEE